MILKQIPLKHLMISWMGILFLFQNSALATGGNEELVGYEVLSGREVRPSSRNWSTSNSSSYNSTSNTPSPYQQQYAQPGQIYGANPSLSNNSGIQARLGTGTQYQGPSPAEREAQKRADIERMNTEARQRAERSRRAQEQETERKNAAFESRKKAATDQALAEATRAIDEEQRAARERIEAKRQARRLEQAKKMYAEQLEKDGYSLEEFCFPGSTLINTPLLGEQGKHIGSQLVPISSVKVGDWVYSCGLNSMSCQLARLSHVFQREAKKLVEISVQGKTIQATPNHPFYVVNRGEVIPAQDLNPQDLLLDIGGNTLHQDQPIREIEGNFTVYNIEVEGHHTYYAESVLVHNCDFIKNLSTPDVAVGLSTAVGAMGLGGAATLGGPIGVAAYVGSAAVLGHALHEATKTEGKAQEEGENGAAEKESKQFTEEQQSLVEMAKKDKKTGISKEDMETYKQLNKEAGKKGFTEEDAVRGPEVHPDRKFGKTPHGHVGPVNHIPIKK